MLKYRTLRLCLYSRTPFFKIDRADDGANAQRCGVSGRWEPLRGSFEIKVQSGHAFASSFLAMVDRVDMVGD